MDSLVNVIPELDKNRVDTMFYLFGLTYCIIFKYQNEIPLPKALKCIF